MSDRRSRWRRYLVPALIGAAVFAALLSLPPARPRTLAALLTPQVTAIVLALRWLRERSVERRTRALGAGLALATALALGLALPFPTNLIAVLWGWPLATAVMLMVFLALPRRSPWLRATASVAGAVAALVPWLFLRADGASGEMMPNLVWRRAAAAEAPIPRAASAAPSARHAPLTVTADDWPGFRGQDRDGVVSAAAAAALELDWTRRPPVERWRRPIGAGWSSFAVVGGLACTQDRMGGMERVLCLDADTGRTVWAHETPADFDDVASGPGPRATPQIADGRLYALGAAGRLDCLDARTGRPIWSADLAGPRGETPEWGFAGSPLVVGDAVFVSPAGVGGVRLLALDRDTGERLWQAEGGHAGYASPQLATLGGMPQVLLFDGGGLASYDPGTGAALWQHVWINALPMAAQPQVVGRSGAGDTVLIGMGYGRGTRSLAVSRGAAGWTVSERWSTARLKPKFNGVVIHDGHVFGLDEGILVCLDLATGERRWKGGRYGYGQLLLLGDRLLVVTEAGDLVLVAASPDGHRELARVPGLGGKSWSHPALARGRLYLRNASQAACFDLAER